MTAPLPPGKEFMGRGWAFPFAFEPSTGKVASAAAEEDIRQSIWIILSTSKGERVMRPEFGCGIHDLVFAVINTETITRVRREVEEALRIHEARIEVLAVKVDGSGASTEGRLIITLDFRVRQTNQRGNFVYPFYFREAA